MAKTPVARVGDTGSHGGTITTGSSIFLDKDKPIARVGDIYSCPEHGPNPIATGAPHVFGQGKHVAHVGSRTACGAVITSGSSKVFVDVCHEYQFNDLEYVNATPNKYENMCKVCGKSIDGPPLQDKSYNVHQEQSAYKIICDANWDRKLRKIISDGENDIDKIWQKMCQWYVDHKSRWSSRESFINMIVAMYGLFGKLYRDLSPDDQKRWRQVKEVFGNIRFGGRGEINYPSFDKLQHFLGGAYIGNKYSANIVGTVVEVKDAFTRWFKDYITKNRESHHVGYDIHDLEWTWAGGGFTSAILRQSQNGMSKILIKFANSDLIFSDIYTSIMPNKDPSPEYEDNHNIDHAEWSFPNLIQYPIRASLINSQIKKMENLIYESAK